jgi:hypothetical protein
VVVEEEEEEEEEEVEQRMVRISLSWTAVSTKGTPLGFR